MAYISSTGTSGQTTTVSSFEATLPPQIDAGDYLVAFIAIRPGTTGTMSSTGGWTQYNAGTSTPTVRLLVWSKVASASETPPTFTWSGSAPSWSIVIHAIKDYDTTTPIHTFSHLNNAASTTFTVPAITTTTNNCLLVYGCSSDSSTPMPTTTDIYWRAMGTTTAAQTNAMTGTFQQDASGTKASFTLTGIQSRVSQFTILAFNNASGGSKEINKIANVTRIRDMGNYDTGAFLTFAAPNAGVSGLTSINGINLTGNTSTVSASVTSNSTMWFYQYQWAFNLSSGGVDVWEGAWNTLAAPVNIQNKIVSQSFALLQTQFSPVYGTIIVFADASNNWVAYELIARKNYVFNTQLVKHIAIGTTTAYASGGTIDWTAVTKVGWFTARRSTGTSAQNLAVSRLLINDGTTLIGGGVNNPINYGKFQEAIYNASLGASHSNLQGAGQFFNRSSMQIGNGTATTYVNVSGQSFEFPTASDATWAGSAASDKFELRVKSSVNDVLDFSSSLFNTSIQQNLIIDPTGTLPTTPPDFSGSVWLGWDIENNLSGWEFKSTVFKNSKITLNGGLITDSTLTGKTGITTVITNNPENISGCSFTSGGTGHAIEITATGTYDFFNNTFSGYGADGTTNACIYNNSGGLVTLVLQAADQVPTVRNGAGASTVLDIPPVAVTVPSALENSRIQIYNVTTSTEIDNAVVGAGGYSYVVSSSQASDGDILRLRLTYHDGLVYKEAIEQQAVFSDVSGATFLVSQVDNDVATQYGIDGSTVTEVSWDGANIEIDVDNPIATWSAQRVYAWYSYYITTATGIADAFGRVVALDVGNIELKDVLLDNLQATTAAQTDAIRVFNKDFLLPVKNPTTGGGGFSFFSTGQIFTVAVGSGVTPADKTDIITGVRAEMDSSSTKLIGIKKNTDLIPGAL